MHSFPAKTRKGSVLFQLGYEDDQRTEKVGNIAVFCKKLWLWGQLDRARISTLAPVNGAASGKSLNTSESHFLFCKIKKYI